MSTDPAETRVDTTIIPAVTGTRQPISCGGCGEVFAAAAFGGRGLFLADTLHAAALSAGWQQDDTTWTCTVCLAKADAEPQPEPEPVAPVSEPAPAPDGDHYDQSIALLAAFEARVDGFWADVNRSNDHAAAKVRTRLDDGYALIRELAAGRAA